MSYLFSLGQEEIFRSADEVSVVVDMCMRLKEDETSEDVRYSAFHSLRMNIIKVRSKVISQLIYKLYYSDLSMNKWLKLIDYFILQIWNQL